MFKVIYQLNARRGQGHTFTNDGELSTAANIIVLKRAGNDSLPCVLFTQYYITVVVLLTSDSMISSTEEIDIRSISSSQIQRYSCLYRYERLS